MRIAHAVRELNEKRPVPLRLVAVCDDGDRHALFARVCDEVVTLDGAGPDAFERALRAAGADSAWIGREIAVRRPELPEVCSRLGITIAGGCADAHTGVEPQGVEPQGVELDSGARRLGVQLAKDTRGQVQVLGVLDITLRRDGDDVLVESVCPMLDDEGDRAVLEACTRLAERHEGPFVATFEVLHRAGRSMPVQVVSMCADVEHQTTEMTTGLDLGKLSLQLADGAEITVGGLDGGPPEPRGHAVEVVLRAEDPARGFARSTGAIERMRLPTGAAVRVDAALAEGDVVRGTLDPTLARIAAWGPSRDEALAKLRRALADTVVVVRDGTTNQGFLLELLANPGVRRGVVDTSWIEREERLGGFTPVRGAELALVMAAIEVARELDAVEQARFYGWARRGRPRVGIDLGHTIELRHQADAYAFGVWRLGPTRWRIEIDADRLEVDVDRLGRHERRLHAGGDAHRVVTWPQGADLLVSVDGVAHRIAREDVGLVRTQAPAVVVAVPVSAGDEVQAGDAVAIVESMKMETVLRAPFAGRVRTVLAGTNVQVDAGTPLLRLDPIREPIEAGSSTRLSFRDLGRTGPVDPVGLCEANHRLAEWLLLGFDVPDEDVARVATQEHQLCASLGVGHPTLLEAQDRVLRLFADLRSLARPRDRRDGEAQVRSPNEHLHAFLRSLDPDAEGLPPRYVALLSRVAAAYGLDGLDRTPALEEALYRAYRSLQREDAARTIVLAVLTERLETASALVEIEGPDFRELLDRLIGATQVRDPVLADLARQVRYRYFDQPVLDAAREATHAAIEPHIAALAGPIADPERAEHIRALVNCPQHLAQMLTSRIRSVEAARRPALLEVMTRRHYRMREFDPFRVEHVGGLELLVSSYEHEGVAHRVATAFVDLAEIGDVARAVATWAAMASESAQGRAGEQLQVDLYAQQAQATPIEQLGEALATALAPVAFSPGLDRLVIGAARPAGGDAGSPVELFTFRRGPDGHLHEERAVRGMHPMMAERLQLWRLANFELERLPSADDVYLYHAIAHENARDERLFAIAEVRDLMPVHDARGRVVTIPELELVLSRAAEGIRRFQALRPPARRLQWNRILLHVWPPIELDPDEIRAVSTRLARGIGGLGIEMTMVHGRLPDHPGGALRDRVLRVSSRAGSGVLIEIEDPPTQPLQPLDEYTRKVVQARSRGTYYPYELARVLAPPSPTTGFPRGEFVEHDLDESGRLVPVERPRGRNEAGIVVGVVHSYTDRHPEGMTRVALFGDPTRSLGAISHPECRRIIAALDLAEQLGVPVEWFALSAGARIAMESGTENMDGVAAVLRRIVELTQRGGEINVVVAGINVGAQPYWNAEATMLMHTRGILVMTPESAMVLTGKQALEYSGAVSAEDNFGIGGYERIMGPNGQAQYWARDLTSACRLLLAHYEHTYTAPGERFPRRAHTTDPATRDVREYPHTAEGSDFRRVGDIFSLATNPDRKKSFDMRTLMRACVDQDHPTLERWPEMRGASTAVVWDAHLGGWPITLVGIESRTLQRHGPVPADGPDRWSAGTLFPLSSKKVARAVNATSGNRPLVVLANLSGFDGSPESMRSLQLEFGAEIGRSIVNFDGPIVFCVVSRFHGGAFVVFSRHLNDDLETIAVRGSRASVIGGAPAAAVVFSHEVDVRTRTDARIVELDERIARAEGADRERLRAQRTALAADVRADKLGELADEFDAIHSVERALDVGSIDAIIDAADIRPRLVDAVERGISRTLDRLGEQQRPHTTRGSPLSGATQPTPGS